MNYAYLDDSKILHVSKIEKSAKEKANNGKVVEYDGKCRHGFPIVFYKKEERQITVFSLAAHLLAT